MRLLWRITLIVVWTLDELRRRRELAPDLKLFVDINLHLPTQELVYVWHEILTV